jgi:hypothetical protein
MSVLVSEKGGRPYLTPAAAVAGVARAAAIVGNNDGSRLLVRLVADMLTRLLSPTRTSQILGDVGYAAGSRRLLLSIGSARMVRGQWFEYAFDRGGHVRVGRWTRGLWLQTLVELA